VDRTTLLAGACAGVVGTLLGYPFDTVKSRLATAAAAGRPDTAGSIAREVGLRGLYAGVGSPLLSLVILNTMGFSTFAAFARLLGCDTTNSALSPGARGFEPRLMLAGGLSGLCASFVSTPFELLKVQVQVQDRPSSMGGLTWPIISLVPPYCESLAPESRNCPIAVVQFDCFCD
jgi:hypothetical protein